jgi:methyltransferase (TIGR00027 family)
MAITSSLAEPSRTAVLTAAARALHRDEPAPWVLDDPLAAGLAGPDGTAMMARLRAELPAPGLLAFVRWVCVRSRFAEDTAEEAASRGVGQYVIVGAALDSFACRRGDLQARMRVFEVDHPATQAWKRQRLADLGLARPPNLAFVPADLGRQPLRDALEAAGFDASVPAVFSWLGVTMYLRPEAIRATLAAVANCAAGTRIVLTYNQPQVALQGLGAQVEAVMARLVGDLGEPFVSLFTPGEAEQLLREHGFGEVTHFGPGEALATYFSGRTDVRLGGAQRLIAATVT